MPEVWVAARVSVHCKFLTSLIARYDVIPLKPLTQPVKLLVVIPVYVIISSPTFIRPHSLGNPLVDHVPIPSVVSVEVIVDANATSPCITSLVKLSILIYLSIFSAISTTPPWCSCEM